MKRSINRIIVVAALLVVLGTMSVFATQEKSTSKIAFGDDGLKFDSGENMTAATLNYSSSKMNEATLISTSGGDTYYVYSIAVKATGKLYVNAYANASNSASAKIIVGAVSGSVISHFESGDRYVYPGNTETFIGAYDVKKGKTYYVGIQSSYAAEASVAAFVIPYSTRTLKAGKTMITSGYKGSNNKDSVARFKIKAKKTGHITVYLKRYGLNTAYGYVTLLNSKKKAVSDKLIFNSSFSSDYVVFGVKKGTTYYLKVSGCQGSYDNGYAYGIKYSIKAATLKKNKSKRTAVTLKRKAKAKSITRPATGKKMTQWYKFIVSKKQKTIFRVDASAVKSGKATITLFYGSKKIASDTITNGKINNYTITNGTTYYKANKGTYYVRITSNAKCNGMYKVRYLK